MSYAINVDDLIKKYSSVKNKAEVNFALDHLDLNIKTGSIFGLLGPNGAGKSTLINILAGTVVKDSGTVKVMDIDIDKQPKSARSLMGIVPQEIFVDTFFSLRNTLEFTAGYYGIRPKDRITDQLLKTLSLYDKKDSFPQKLSGGMKRRFLIAKAMVHSPKILILDEPTAGVDIELRTQLWEYVKKINQEQGTTIIITTHYLAEAQELCDDIAFINGGKIIKQDSKKKLLTELGSRYLYIEFEDSLDLKKFSNSEKENCQILEKNTIRFDLHTENNDFQQIFGKIYKMNVKIKNLNLKEPDLEDIFHKVVRY